MGGRGPAFLHRTAAPPRTCHRPLRTAARAPHRPSCCVLLPSAAPCSRDGRRRVDGCGSASSVCRGVCVTTVGRVSAASRKRGSCIRVVVAPGPRSTVPRRTREEV